MKIGNNWRIVIVFLNANVKFFFFFFHFLLQHLACASALLLLLSFLPVRRSEEKKQNKKEEEREEGVGLAGKRGMYKMTKAAAVVVYLTCWRVARPSKAFRLVCLECERPLLPFVKHSQHTHTHTHKILTRWGKLY